MIRSDGWRLWVGYELREGEALERLATLMVQRNAVAAEIAAMIGRPALIGHIGEFIAARVFGIQLEASASHSGHDGRFTSGRLTKGRTVNVKFYGKQERVLDIRPNAPPDLYLVLTGPRPTKAGSHPRPWVIESVYLFDAQVLIGQLRERGVKIGASTSVATVYWDDAEVFPRSRSELLQLTDEQRRMLELFGRRAG